MPKNNPYNISASAKGKAGDLYVYGEIVQSKWCDEDVTPLEVLDELKKLKECSEIIIHVNSYGGSVDAGNAIISNLKMQNAKIIGVNEGIAASMATAILAGCDEVKAFGNSMFMYHKPLCNFYGNSNDFRKRADLLDKYEDNFVSLYMKRFKGTEEELRELLAAETWLTAQEAFDFGFVDTVEEIEINVAASAKGIVFNKLEIGKDTNIYKTLSAKGAINNMEIKAKLKELGLDILDTDTSDTILAKLNDGFDGIIASIQAKAKTASPEPTPAAEPTPTEPTSVPAPAEPTATHTISAQVEPTAAGAIIATADPAIVAKAEAFDKYKNGVVDEAIKHGIQAKGEDFNEERWRKIFDAMEIDEIKAQADEWAAIAKTVLHTGRVSQEPDTSTISDEINPDNFKI